MAKHFDKNNDGKLDAEERKAAMHALKNVSFYFYLFIFKQGFEDNFVWGVDQSGTQRQFRILQKRGVFVDAEDFQPLTSTYPEHPLSKVVPKVKNFQELKDHRLASYRNDVKKYN